MSCCKPSGHMPSTLQQDSEDNTCNCKLPTNATPASGTQQNCAQTECQCCTSTTWGKSRQPYPLHQTVRPLCYCLPEHERSEKDDSSSSSDAAARRLHYERRHNCRHLLHQRGNSVLRLLRRPPYSCPLSGSPMTESMLCRLSVLPEEPSFRCSMDGDTCKGHGMHALGGRPEKCRLIFRVGHVGLAPWLAVVNSVLHNFEMHTCKALAASTCLFSALAVGFIPPARMHE